MTRSQLGIAWVEYWNKLLYQGVLPHKLKEMCRIKISVAHQCGYCSTLRSTVAKAEGLTEDMINHLCVSGFANSSGGIIVWGVDARKNAQDVDCAVGRKEIEPIKLFLSRLNALTGQAVSPIVDGIRHRAIETTENSGFAITLVPETESGPHMAKLGEDRYYKRSGDSFYKMEHFDLEDMFGRRPEANLRN
jgi:AhpD family alkylhydroperoxidase